MPTRKGHPSKKRRTREHVIAELGVNHVERHALLCGFSVERIEHDYGIDLILFTYNSAGEVENGEIYLQVKATDHLRWLASGKEISFQVESAHLGFWRGQMMPVILVVYDTKTEVAYWLYVQAYLESRRGVSLAGVGAEFTVRIPRKNVLDRAAILRFRGYRNAILAQTKRVIHHHE